MRQDSDIYIIWIRPLNAILSTTLYYLRWAISKALAVT